MMRRREPCPVVGCIDCKARGHLMCRRHWRAVPAPLRQTVNSRWKAVTAATIGRERIHAIRLWRAAANAAVISIHEQEGLHVVP